MAATEAPPDAHVLYVDDEEPNLIVFRAALADLYPVLTTTNARDALALMETHEVGVLLTDQRMPEVTGAQLLAQASKLQPHTLRMLVTAHSNLDAALDAINEGQVRRYLRRPWTTAELVATVADAYAVYQTEKALRALEQRLLETERYYALGLAAAGIAHELRNPATWVRNGIQLCRRTLLDLGTLLDRPQLDRDTARDLLARGDQLLENALQGSQRIADIVEAVEAPARKHSAESVDMDELWRTTKSLIDYHTGGRIPIELGPGSWPRAAGSRTALSQILTNVMINAVEAVRAKPDGCVWVSHEPTASDLLIHVDDNGDGVAASDRERIFDPFHSHGKPEGCGLGLAISRRIAREHGGELLVSDSVHGGARFSLRLPLAV